MAIVTSTKTGRQLKVVELTVKSKEVIEEYHKRKSVQDIGWMILEQAADLARRQQHGESSQTNFALSIFENALDWRLGRLGFELAQAAIKAKRHKLLRLGVDRNGDIWALKSGRQIG